MKINQQSIRRRHPGESPAPSNRSAQPKRQKFNTAAPYQMCMGPGFRRDDTCYKTISEA